jgi:uncharacterized membrane protein YecN with MAPEG domain
MPAIAALYAALIGILLVVLTLPISRLRGKLGVGLGDGGNPALERAIRVHANAVEWAVPAILLLLVADLTRAPVWFLHACGITLIVARIIHALGLSRKSGHSFGRFAGASLSALVVVALSLWGLWAFPRTLAV